MARIQWVLCWLSVPCHLAPEDTDIIIYLLEPQVFWFTTEIGLVSPVPLRRTTTTCTWVLTVVVLYFQEKKVYQHRFLSKASPANTHQSKLCLTRIREEIISWDSLNFNQEKFWKMFREVNDFITRSGFGPLGWTTLWRLVDYLFKNKKIKNCEDSPMPGVVQCLIVLAVVHDGLDFYCRNYAGHWTLVHMPHASWVDLDPTTCILF